MMRGVPFSARFLGLMGLIPFAYGVLLHIFEPGTLPTFGFYSSDASGGQAMLASFGAIILGFMGGCLWAFASRGGTHPALMDLALSSLPSVFAFAALGLGDQFACIALALGFSALQMIDILFHRRGMTPEYWLQLRFPLTISVIVSLLVGASHG